jgi:type I restriction enzyme M protein
LAVSSPNLFSTWIKQGSDIDVSNVRETFFAFICLIHPERKRLFQDVIKSVKAELRKIGENASKQTKAISNLSQLTKPITMDGKRYAETQR